MSGPFASDGDYDLPGSGYMTLIGECGNCGRIFQCNPDTVPSTRHEGRQLIFCEPCVRAANPARVERGLAPIVIADGTYP